MKIGPTNRLPTIPTVRALWLDTEFVARDMSVWFYISPISIDIKYVVI